MVRLAFNLLAIFLFGKAYLLDPRPVYNVHVIAHSHMDAGWQRTLDDYYNVYIVTILDHVTEALLANPERTFT
jgi:hypothetical protein